MFKISINFDEKYFTPETYHKIAVIEECVGAVNEGVVTNDVITMTLSYTHSLALEMLENIKEALLKLCSLVLSALNNYILNNAKYVERYKEILKVRIAKLDKPFLYEYYEYNFEKDYPHVLKTNTDIEAKIVELQSKIKQESWSAEKVSAAVDNILEWFSDKTIDATVDPYDVSESAKELVRKHIQGRKVDKGIDERTLDKFIDEITEYKYYADSIKRTKTAILSDYNLLKKSYEKAIAMPSDIKYADKLSAAYNPELYAFNVHEKRRFLDINTEMSRLFNGFIKIYEASFDTKLQILHERIELNRAIIAELLTRTQLTPLINTKHADKNKKPYKYEPRVKI